MSFFNATTHSSQNTSVFTNNTGNVTDVLSNATTALNLLNPDYVAPTFANFYGIFLPLLCFFGVLGNVAAVVVYTRPYMRGSCTTYLTALALCDILFLLAAVTLYTPESFLWVIRGETPNAGEHLIAYAHIFPLFEMSAAFVASFTVVATFDHFAFSFKPRQFAKWSTTEAAIKVSVGTVGIVFLIHFLSVFKFQVDKFQVFGKTIVRVCMSSLYESHSFQILDKYVYFVLFDLLPSLILLVFDCELFRRNRKQTQYDDDDKPMFLFRDGRSTRVILALGILRIIVSVPNIAISISLYLRSPMFTDSLMCLESAKNMKYELAGPLGELYVVGLSVLFSSCKFLLYMLLNSQFRMTFVMLCCCQSIEETDDDEIELNPIPLVNPRSTRRRRTTSGSSNSVFTTDSSIRPYVLPTASPSNEVLKLEDTSQETNKNNRTYQPNGLKPSHGYTNRNFISDNDSNDPYESISSGPRRDANKHPYPQPYLHQQQNELRENNPGKLQAVYKPQRSGQMYVVPNYKQRKAVPGLGPSGSKGNQRFSDISSPERPPSPQPPGSTRAVLVRPCSGSPPPGKGPPRIPLQRGYEEDGSFRTYPYAPNRKKTRCREFLV